MYEKIVICICLLWMSFNTASENTREEVSLKRCVDGDTTHFTRKGEDIKVRYLAINAPEYTKEKQPYGKEASEYVCDVLTNAKSIELEYDDGSNKEDKYGRTLAWVYADGVLVQKELVKQGLAEVKYLYGDYAYTEELQALEKTAKQQKLRMWSDNEKSQNSEVLPMVSAVTGGFLILIGLIFTKGRKRKKYIKKGMTMLKKK